MSYVSYSSGAIILAVSCFQMLNSNLRFNVRIETKATLINNERFRTRSNLARVLVRKS